MSSAFPQVGVAGASRDFIHLRDEKAANTAGGTATTGSWLTRVLNVEAADDGGHCALSANQFTLEAGTYELIGWAMLHGVNRCRHRIQNVTDTATVLLGQSGFASAGGNSNTPMPVIGRFTIGASKALELQYRVETTVSGDGLGVAVNWDSAVEVYADLMLWKVA